MSEKRLSPVVVDGLEYLKELGYTEVHAPVGRPASELPAKPDAKRDQEPQAKERARQLQQIAEEASGCERCGLSRGRNNVVFGSGPAGADLMLIGEAPGAEEDRQGLPFVGPAGELLTRILAAIELDRSDVYIANIVKCRPPGNRDPLPEESAACRQFLERQIELIAPRVIVALGRIAAQDLLESDLSLGRLRGQWHRVKGIPTRVTYHPAALLRNSSWKRPTWEDIQEVRDRLKTESGG